MRHGIEEHPASPNGAKPPPPVVPPAGTVRVGSRTPYIGDARHPEDWPPKHPWSEPPRYQAQLSLEQMVALERADWPADGSYLYRLALLRVEMGRLGDIILRALGILAMLAWLERRPRR